MRKIRKALKELVGNTSERTAGIAAVIVKAACFVPNVCPIVDTVFGYVGMSPDQFVGAAITYMMLRFASKAQKAPA